MKRIGPSPSSTPRWKLASLITLAALIVFAGNARAQTATITWNTTFQTIDGFGASDAFCVNQAGYDTCNLTDAQADLFFSPIASGGIGLSMLRAEVPDDGSCTGTCSIPGTVTMTKAVARGAIVWATPWSPPASMKTNGDVICTAGGGSGALSGGSYGAYATYLTNYAQQLRSSFAINLYALSVQNEPDFCPTYDGALWSAANLHDFILNNLGPSFVAAGLTTRIMLPETAGSNNLAAYADTTMNDGNAAAFVGLVATHDYATPGTANPVTYTNGGKPLWETETSDFNAADPTITSGLAYAQEIHDWMTGSNATAWLEWWMVNSSADNEGLIEMDGTITKRFYTLGNFSRFVRPGYTRIAATANPQSGVYVSAYKLGNNFCIVAINTNGSGASQTFSTSAFTTTSVTPYVTSASLNLVQQSALPVTGTSFTTTLAASSVTTFVGTLSAVAPAATPTQAPPVIILEWQNATMGIDPFELITGATILRAPCTGTVSGTTQPNGVIIGTCSITPSASDFSAYYTMTSFPNTVCSPTAPSNECFLDNAVTWGTNYVYEVESVATSNPFDYYFPPYVTSTTPSNAIAVGIPINAKSPVNQPLPAPTPAPSPTPTPVPTPTSLPPQPPVLRTPQPNPAGPTVLSIVAANKLIGPPSIPQTNGAFRDTTEKLTASWTDRPGVATAYVLWGDGKPLASDVLPATNGGRYSVSWSGIPVNSASIEVCDSAQCTLTVF